MKTTPHTVFIYQHGSFLRIVRGEHSTPAPTVKPRRYDTIAEALQKERNPKVRELLTLYFPTDKVIDRRIKTSKKPVKVAQYRTLADAIKSRWFLFAQAGYDSERREIAAIYHRAPNRENGLALAARGPLSVVRKLLKKYKKPNVRELDYKERKPRLSTAA